jgi:hypothetical protein
MKQFDFETIKETFAPEKFIAQAEKNTQAILAYVEPKELSKTLVALTSDATDFVRAQLAAFESITAIVKTQSEEFTKQFTKVANSK